MEFDCEVMPRRKKALLEKNQAWGLPKSEEPQIVEKEIKDETPFTRALSKPTTTVAEIDRKQRLDRILIPCVGDRVLYVEFGERDDGKVYCNQFLGVITSIYPEKDDPSTVHFWANFPSYRNHHLAKTPNPVPFVEDYEGDTFIYFHYDYLTPKNHVSTCYIDKFCGHIMAPSWRYLHEKIMKSYFVARNNSVFPTINCKYGTDCSNDKIGHLINFSHHYY